MRLIMKLMSIAVMFVVLGCTPDNPPFLGTPTPTPVQGLREVLVPITLAIDSSYYPSNATISVIYACGTQGETPARTPALGYLSGPLLTYVELSPAGAPGSCSPEKLEKNPRQFPLVAASDPVPLQTGRHWYQAGPLGTNSDSVLVRIRW